MAAGEVVTQGAGTAADEETRGPERDQFLQDADGERCTDPGVNQRYRLCAVAEAMDWNLADLGAEMADQCAASVSYTCRDGVLEEAQHAGRGHLGMQSHDLASVVGDGGGGLAGIAASGVPGVDPVADLAAWLAPVDVMQPRRPDQCPVAGEQQHSVIAISHCLSDGLGQVVCGFGNRWQLLCPRHPRAYSATLA